MASPTGCACTPQEVYDLVDGALIQGGGWANLTFARDVARRNATDTIQVWATGTESGPRGSILGPAGLCDDESPHVPPLTAQPQNGIEHTPTPRLAHRHLSDLIWGLEHTRRTAFFCTDTEEPTQARAEALEWREKGRAHANSTEVLAAAVYVVRLESSVAESNRCGPVTSHGTTVLRD